MAKRISYQPQTSTARMRTRTVTGMYSTIVYMIRLGREKSIRHVTCEHAVSCDWSILLLSVFLALPVTLCGAARHCLVHRCPGSTSDPL